MAGEGSTMNEKRSPPRWAEAILEAFLAPEDRQTLIGDLREEFAEVILPENGRYRANWWYLRQAVSLLPGSVSREGGMRATLFIASVLSVVCGCWLVTMEMLMRHPGYGSRTAFDAEIALIPLATIIVLALHLGTRTERWLRPLGALPICIAVWAFVRDALSTHFEGFVLVVSVALAVQGNPHDGNARQSLWRFLGEQDGEVVMTQTIDFRFEILFLLGVAATLVTLLVVIGMALARRGSTAKKLLKILGISWGAYLAVVLAVAATRPQLVIPMNHDLCFDEMCFAVVNVQTATELGPASQPVRADGIFYIVTVRASSHARGRAQKENGLFARLWSPQRTYAVSAKGQAAWEAAHPENAPLITRLAPGQAVFSEQVFDLPAPATGLGLVLSNGFGPGYFVIGECPLLHKPTILRLSAE